MFHQDSTSELLAASRIKLGGMHQLLEASTALTSLDSNIIAQNILHEIIRILHCDRSSVYVCDNVSQEILVHSSISQERVRVPHDDYFDNSLSGSTISTGGMINVDDPYGDERFDRASDRESGYLTRSVSCVPITGPNGVIIGDMIMRYIYRFFMSFSCALIGTSLRVLRMHI
jgi:hypothetical protein